MAEVVSFHGADGCGKSSIAAELTAMRLQNRPVAMIGGSSYTKWLTPEVARETLGYTEVVGADPKTPAEKCRLYEEIAVACYSYANHLAEQGSDVVIDSDPVLKRVLWSRLEQSEQSAQLEYVSRFGAYLIDRLPAYTQIDLIVGVNTNGQTSDSEIAERLSIRGGNSEYDPQTAEEVHTICSAATALWRDIVASRDGKSTVTLFNTLYSDTTFTHVDNPGCDRGTLTRQLQARAATVNRLLQ